MVIGVTALVWHIEQAKETVLRYMEGKGKEKGEEKEERREKRKG